MFATPSLLSKLVGANPALWVQYFNVVLFAAGLLAIHLLLRGRGRRRSAAPVPAATHRGRRSRGTHRDFYGEMFTMVYTGDGEERRGGRRQHCQVDDRVDAASRPATKAGRRAPPC